MSSQRAETAKKAIGILFGACGVTAGAAFYFVKMKNDEPARWYRLTHKNPTLTPLDKTPPFQYSACAIQGKRDHMEDRCICAPSLLSSGNGNAPAQASFFGVFDGHGGHVSSTFVSQNLAAIVTKNIRAIRSVEDWNADVPAVLRKSLVTVHKDLLEQHPEKSSRDGTTAVTCLLGEGKIWTANIGDSRAVLSRSCRAIPLSKDHKPDDPEEMARIEAAGGEVLVHPGDCPRVYFRGGRGGLAMSRALGDEFYKQEGHILVPCDADVTEFQAHEEDEFIILASDGLWDVLSSEEAVDFVHSLRHVNPRLDASYLAQSLVYRASQLGSTDNITVVLVVFQSDQYPPSDSPEAPRSTFRNPPQQKE